MTTTQLIDKLFSRLDSWRYFPAYQIERRINAEICEIFS